ncbi:MAG TPA: response regulator transcription factor [Acidimicrobiales bacterium]|nr:response regulator transcription factor [Acidimicrobiales bacterium]
MVVRGQHDQLGGVAYRPDVLVVDDEAAIVDLVALTLRGAGFAVRTAATGRQAMALVAESEPELIVLDVMLPDIDGFAIQSTLAQRGVTTPVLFLSARDAVRDKVRGLTLGAYDYMTKPFSPDELVARTRSVLRRSEADTRVDDGRLTFANLVLDENTHEAWRGDRALQLTPTEFRLLRCLLINERRVLSKAQLLDNVWHYDYDGNGHVVENFISYLRKQVDAEGPPLIHTVRGVGYCLRLPSAGPPAA